MLQILEPGIPVLEVLLTNRPNKIADVVENPVRVLRVTAPNSQFDEPPPVSNTSNNHCEMLAHSIEGGPTHWRSLPYTLPLTGNTQRTRSRWTQKIHFLSQARQHAGSGRVAYRFQHE